MAKEVNSVAPYASKKTVTGSGQTTKGYGAEVEKKIAFETNKTGATSSGWNTGSQKDPNQNYKE